MKALQSIFAWIRERREALRSRITVAVILAWMQERLIPVALAVLLCMFVFFLAVMASGSPEWAYGLFGPEKKFRILEFVGVAMGGVLLAIGAVIAHQRAKAMEGAAKAQAEAAKAQAAANKGAENGRRQERLKNAIEHLGHDSDSVRLGGAYELLHLARDTQGLRQTVLDILCAHIRRTTGEREYRCKFKSEPSEEIQSLLTLLFRQEHKVFRGCRIHLQGSWLAGAILKRARLLKADLSMAYLQNSFLDEARLQAAFLAGAKMQEAFLREAWLQGANLSLAKMQRTDLSGSHLQSVSLYQTQLQGANFSKAFLQGAICQPQYRDPFELRIVAGIGRKNDLSGAIFEGGLSREDVNSLASIMPNEVAGELQQALERHIDQREVHQLPNNSRAIVGEYTEEEAERWIAEFKKARGKKPKAGG